MREPVFHEAPPGDEPAGASLSSSASPTGARASADGVVDGPDDRFGNARPDRTAAGEPAQPVELPERLREAAERLFGSRLDLARAYADLLGTDGVIRGLIGPREAPRLWDRHLLNCAAVAELISPAATIIDVGSGAGLPGIVLAVARPDISVILVEPLARRTAFLDEAVNLLGLSGQVTVERGRAEEFVGRFSAEVVTARAVAPLDRLATWCLPLTTLGGRLLALKGVTAAEEVAETAAAVARLGGAGAVIRQCGTGLIDPPTTVVEIVRERDVVPKGSRSPKGGARGGRRQHGR
jgi:16S rRNA (guanine527-N7)-methyltransferase